MELKNTLGPFLGKTSKMIGCLINDILLENGVDITREQWLVLLKLHQNDGQSQIQLAHVTERDKTSLTRLIKIMERKELVVRIKDKKDKRINLVFLTNIGKSKFLKALPLMQQTINKLQEGLTQQEIQNTIIILQKLQNNIKNYESTY